MKAHPVFLITSTIAALVTTGLYPLAQFLAVVPWGTGYVLTKFILLWPACLSASILLTIVSVVLLKGAYRRLTVVILIAALLILPRPFAAWAGNQIRHGEFVRLAERSKPLIAAIERYKQHAHRLPSSLNELVPSFLPRVPGTGMPAYPEYTYSADAQAGAYAIVISTPNVGILNLDELRFSSNGKYPEYGKDWEPIGEWKYYHAVPSNAMGLLDIFRIVQLRRRQRQLVEELDRGGVQYSNNNGETVEDRVVIRGALTDLDGIAAEYGWLFRRFGTMDVDWQISSHAGGSGVDVWVIQLRTGEEKTIYFDVTESFGK